MAAPAIEYHRHLIGQCTDHIHSDPDGNRTAHCSDFCCAGVAPPTSTVATPSVTETTPASNPNGPGCSSQRPDKCGQWTPEQPAFACRATLAGADYTTDLKRTLMNHYGLSEESAFFLGKEAMYSINSGGYISIGGNADGPHPLCNGIIP